MRAFDNSSTIKGAVTADGNIVEELSKIAATVSAQAATSAKAKCRMSNDGVKWIPSEAAFQSAILALAQLAGWRVYHTHDSRHSPAGFPDLVMVRGRRLVFAELKSGRGKVSAAQQQWLQALAGVPGAEVRVWRPADWPAIERELIGD